MSLNWKEIDLIISEIHFEKARIQEVYQPTLKKVYLELYANKTLQRLLINLEQGQVGMHLIDKKLQKPKIPQRFQQLLQSKIIGMYIQSITHINKNRIIQLHLKKKQALDDKKNKKHTNDTYIEYFLYLKLWSNNSNIILTTLHNEIIDVLYRSKKQNIMPKQVFVIPPQRNIYIHSNKTIRTWPPERYNNSFNTFIQEYYKNQNKEISRTKIIENIKKNIQKQILFNTEKLATLHDTLEKYNNTQEYEAYGNSILSSLHTITQSQRTLSTKQYTIPLDTTLTPIENAEYYFKKAKKSKRSLQTIQERITQTKNTLQYLSNLKTLIPEENNIPIPETLLSFYSLQKKNQSFFSKNKNNDHLKTYTKTILSFPHALIFIGKNAKENDELLRHCTRGEDTWLHVRKNKGAFVFVRLHKNPRTHTIPLSLLLECANITAFYSKIKDNAIIEVYYTKVKYLKRVKGTVGRVIPSHEKIMHITVNNEKARKFIGSYLLSP